MTNRRFWGGSSVDLNAVDAWRLEKLRMTYFCASHAMVMNVIFETELSERTMDCRFVEERLGIHFMDTPQHLFTIHMTQTCGCTLFIKLQYERGMTKIFKTGKPICLRSKLTGKHRRIETYEYVSINTN